MLRTVLISQGMLKPAIFKNERVSMLLIKMCTQRKLEIIKLVSSNGRAERIKKVSGDFP